MGPCHFCPVWDFSKRQKSLLFAQKSLHLISTVFLVLHSYLMPPHLPNPIPSRFIFTSIFPSNKTFKICNSISDMLPRESSLWHRWCWWKVLFIYFHIPRDLGQTLAEGESEKNPKIIYVCVHMWIFQTTSYHLKKILWDFSCFSRKAHIPWTSLSVLLLYPIDFLSLCLSYCLSWGIPWFHCWPFFFF